MKTPVKASVFTALLVALSLCAVGVQARSAEHYLSIKGAVEMGRANGALGRDIRLYFSDQSHSAVAVSFARGVEAKGKVKVAHKGEDEACNAAMVEALATLQERARKEGGNAVIGIRSYYKKASFNSKQQFECIVGGSAKVFLSGDIVKLKE
ncbi:MAG: YbjQ family protein [Proteobacteria bacterium]|nr:YbjQ family protein [Pseudomonadota bacterium]